MFRRRIHAAAAPPRAAFFQQPPPRNLRRMRRSIFLAPNRRQRTQLHSPHCQFSFACCHQPPSNPTESSRTISIFKTDNLNQMEFKFLTKTHFSHC